MYKRPPLRIREVPTKIHEPVSFKEGTFLHTLLKKEPTKWAGTGPKQPIYQKEVYLALLKRNCYEMGIEYKEPVIPDYVPETIPDILKEPDISHIDKVYLKLRILKSGIIRVKLETSIAQLYENYYQKGIKPPIKVVIQTYKTMGFSPMFLEKIKKKHDKLVEFSKKASKIIDTIFNKEPVKKPKKKKEEEIIENNDIPEDEDLDEENDEDDIGDEGELDVEPDEEEIEDDQPQEEMYLSDGGD